jgi:hypothetical protein
MLHEHLNDEAAYIIIGYADVTLDISIGNNEARCDECL